MSGRIANRMSKEHKSITWWKRTSFHSHVIGSATCLLVCAAIAYVYRYDSLYFQDTSSGVSAEEAIEVLRNADEWRKVHYESLQANAELDASIVSLASWIPETVDADDIHTELESLTKANTVQLVSLAYKHSIVGSRVGVAVFTCHLRGSFLSISRTLDGLTKLEHPIGCDRINISHSTDSNSANMTCDAVVSLRCPYAADGTLAFRLLMEDNNHGS